MVQRFAQLHAHLRHLAAGRDHPAAQRLCRGHRLVDPPAFGDVLKLIGDGVLAIFPAEERSRACAAALDAAGAAREAVGALNARRIEKGLPSTDMYLGLHFGEVFYGNIGSKERLDFTVVGPRSTK